jgi:hypothetical protein
MWYVLILYFVGVFFWNIFIEDCDENETELFLNTFLPIIGVAISAILGLFF